MTHKQLVSECETNGLTVRQVPAQDRRSYSATRADGFRVYWSTSYEGGLLGAARIAHKSGDTHVDRLTEIAYYAKL